MFNRDDYDKLTDGLLQGPRYKSDATIDLENIVLAFLNPTATVTCRYNDKQEVEVVINDSKTYHLTTILRNNPDFEHFELNDRELNEYVKFYTTSAQLKPNDSFIPEKKHSLEYLHLAEILAIRIYTDQHYKKINEFLREYAQVTYDSNQLTQEVKELLLAIVIASHGITKTVDQLTNTSLEDSDKLDRFEKLTRCETNNTLTLNSERIEGIQCKKVTQQKGFTSTSAYDYEFSYPGDTKTNIMIPASLMSTAQFIKTISTAKRENEVLFPPNTQLKYYSFVKQKIEETLEVYRYDFEAIPVRSLDDIDPFSYSSTEADKHRLLMSFTNQLFDINHPALTLHALDNIYSLIAKYTSGKTKIYSTLLQQLKTKICEKKLALHSSYVRQKHYSKPFRDSSGDDVIFHEVGKPIYKPNHEGSHGDRVSALAVAVINYYASFAADENFKKFCQDLTCDDILKIQLALLFSVSGRESEIGHSENPDLYKEYKRNSANNFRIYTQAIGMPTAEIEKYAQLIEYMCNPYYVAGKIAEIGPVSFEYQSLFHIMNLAHNLDLMRCSEIGPFQLGIAMAMQVNFKSLVTHSTEEKLALQGLFKMAYEFLVITGGRLCTSFENGQLTEKGRSYQLETFSQCTASAHTALSKLSTITALNRYDKKTTNEYCYATRESEQNLNKLITLLHEWNTTKDSAKLENIFRFLSLLSIDKTQFNQLPPPLSQDEINSYYMKSIESKQTAYQVGYAKNPVGLTSNDSKYMLEYLTQNGKKDNEQLIEKLIQQQDSTPLKDFSMFTINPLLDTLQLKEKIIDQLSLDLSILMSSISDKMKKSIIELPPIKINTAAEEEQFIIKKITK